MRFNVKKNDAFAAALLVGLGSFVVMHGLSFDIGTLSNMGTGFFPVALGVILIFLGALIFLLPSESAEELANEASISDPAKWRGWLCILTGIVAFIVVGKFLGFAPASFALVFISALGDRDHSLLSALGLACFITVVGIVIFSWALELQFPLFRWRW